MASTLWLTGLPASGKSTIAQKLRRWSVQRLAILDGDEFRSTHLGNDLGYDRVSREENVMRAATVAQIMNNNDVAVVAAFVTPYESTRAIAQKIIGPDRFLLVHVDTPLATCEARDPKGLYKRAREGALQNFTGVSDDFEAISLPHLVVDGTNTDQATHEVMIALGLARQL